MGHPARPSIIRLFALALLAAAACRSSWREVRRDPEFQPTEALPLRIAVLPFEDATGGTSLLLYPFLPFIWAANLLTLRIPRAAPDTAVGARVLTELLAARLRGTAVDLVGSTEVESLLAATGSATLPEGLSPRELGERLGVDAVLYGRLLGWSGRYYVVEAHTVVEAHVRIVSTEDDREILDALIGVTDREGLTGGPTGWVSLALTPLAALGNGPYRALAIRWAQLAGDAVLGVEAPAGGDVRIEFAAIVDPLSETLAPGDTLTVEARGTPGCAAHFDLATLRRRIPMIEIARAEADDPSAEDLSVYRGSYLVSEGDRLEGGSVLVTLERGGLRATRTCDGGPVVIGAAGGR